MGLDCAYTWPACYLRETFDSNIEGSIEKL